MAQATADPIKTDRPNKVTITDVGPSRKKVSIEIPAETVAEQLGSSLDTLQVEADIAGFRRGRAPRRLVERKFGSVVRREAKNQLVASAYSQAIEEHKLRVIGEPIGEELEALEIQDGKPLAFEVEVEVPPEFEVPALDGIAVKRPIFAVTDDMIGEQVEKLRLQEGRLENQETPAKGDYLTGHGKLFDADGKVHIDIADAVIQIPPADKDGKGMILGVKVDDFGSQIGLPAVGKTAVIKTTGPANHEIEAIRGAPLKVEFAVARIDRIISATDEELMARFGFSDLAQLRDTIRSKIEERIAIDQAAAMREQIARHLAESVEMALPERMTAAQAERNLSRQRLELMHRGMDPQNIEEHIAELRSASDDAAANELKLFFILDKAAEALGVKVSEGEINGRISQMAMASNERPEKLRADLMARNQVGGIYQQIREHKTLDAILAKATISDIAGEEYAKQREGEGRKRAESRKSAAPAKPPEAKPAKPEPKPAKAEEKPAPKAKSEDKPKAKAAEPKSEKAPAKKPAKKSGK